MRVRAQSASGDMVFGHGNADFYVNSPAAVAQAVQTRLLLFTGEWFLDKTAGMAWGARVLGNRTATTYDPTIKARILGTPGVKSIVPRTYTSVVTNRGLSVECVVDTIYSRISIQVVVGTPAPIVAAPIPINPLNAVTYNGSVVTYNGDDVTYGAMGGDLLTLINTSPAIQNAVVVDLGS